MMKLPRIPLLACLLLGLCCLTSCTESKPPITNDQDGKVVEVQKTSTESALTESVNAATVEETAEKFLTETAAGNYGNAVAFCNEEMQKEMSVEMLQKIWTDLTTQFGKSTGIQAIKTENVLEYVRVHAECHFENGRVVLMVVVDKDLKIAGLFIVSVDQEEREPATASRNKAQEGWRNFLQGNAADAEPLFLEATQLDPTNANAYQGLGWAQLNRGKMNEAKETFLQCMKLDPRNTAALNGLGQIVQLEGDTEKAIEYWTEGANLDPRATGPMAGLAAVYDGRDDYENAIKYYEMWLRAEPNNDVAKAALAKIKEKVAKE